jgi:hypothetical protein
MLHTLANCGDDAHTSTCHTKTLMYSVYFPQAIVVFLRAERSSINYPDSVARMWRGSAFNDPFFGSAFQQMDQMMAGMDQMMAGMLGGAFGPQFPQQQQASASRCFQASVL